MTMVIPDTWWRKRGNNYYGTGPKYCHVVRVLLEEGRQIIVKEHWDSTNPRTPKFESPSRKEEFLQNWEPCNFGDVPPQWGTYIAPPPRATRRWDVSYTELLNSLQESIRQNNSFQEFPFKEIYAKKERKPGKFGSFMRKIDGLSKER